jgi:Fe-S cluster assembly protein SufD
MAGGSVLSKFTVAGATAVEGPAWLRRRRTAAAERFEATNLPTADEEVWRYSRIADLDLERYRPVSGLPTGPAHLAAIPAVGAIVVEGAVVGLSDADPRVEFGLAGEQGLGDLPESPLDAFALLNDAFLTAPLVLRIPRGVEVSEPIVITHHSSTAGEASFPRLVVEVESGASATVVERHTSAPGADILTVPVTQLRVGRGARLRHLVVQDLGLQAWQVGTLMADVDQEGHLSSTVAGFGGEYARQRSDCRLVGRGASCELMAVYFGEGDQTLDFRTFQNHVAQDTTSNLLFKGAVAGHSHSVYTGLIRVGKGARGSNAIQSNRNIKLSEGAWAESVPNLEIENNDVRCAHASAVGPIDEDQRFYLESRGVPRPVAERLVVTGFFDEVLERLPGDVVANELRAMIAGKLDRSDR